MYVPAPGLTADQVLRAFQRDAPWLFLGAMIAAVGVVAAGFSAIRRKFDPVLIYFALFAILYGVRMWLRSNLMGIMMQGSWLYPRVSSAVDFLVPIPAFFYFKAAGFVRRQATVAGYVVGIGLGGIALATLVVGRQASFYLITSILIIAAMIVIVVRSVRQQSDNHDLVVIRRGLLTFVAFVLWQNIQGALGLGFTNIEPIGFVALLAALGYVAARQTLERDRQLGEIQKELEVARRIQMSILPDKFPDSANFRVAARYVPMTSVAGDFYDFIVADDTQAGLLIADVSGHGVPAALIASMVKMAATAQRANAADPSAVLSGMNAALCGNTQDQFVTAAYVHLDSREQELRYSAAGHPPMLRLRAGEITQIAENGLVLAIFDSAAYSTAAHRLVPGDRLLLYTDGIVEAESRTGEFFGQESLEALLRETAGIAPDLAADRIIATVQQWAVSQDDDLTVLVCDYVGKNLLN